jgi:hypothetical protein
MAGSVLSPEGGQGSDEEQPQRSVLRLTLIRQMRAGHAAGVRKTRVIGFPALPIAPCKKSSIASRFAKSSIAAWTSCSLNLDVWLGEYNEKREHSGKYCYGETPWQTFLDSKHLAQAKMLDSVTATASPDVEGQRAEQGLTRRRAAALSS